MKSILSLLSAVLLMTTVVVAQEQPAEASLKLGSGDKVRFRVDEDPSTGSTILMVSALGKITVPVSVGFEDPQVTIDAKGQTLDQLKDSIKKRLEDRYYKTATIKLTLVDKAQKVGQAIFTGETRGVIQIVPGEEIALSTAIAKLSPSEFANLKKVELFRLDKATGQTEKKIIDVETILKKGDRTKDVILQDEDRINVPEKRILFN